MLPAPMASHPAHPVWPKRYRLNVVALTFQSSFNQHPSLPKMEPWGWHLELSDPARVTQPFWVSGCSHRKTGTHLLAV